MAEIPSNVFDILHPSPVSLKKLSSMAVSIETWRHEVHKYRMKRKLRKFEPAKLQISSKTVFPNLPSVLYGEIDKYVARLGPSMNEWLIAHYNEGFHLHYSHQNRILKDFDNFVCDYNGTIDYLKTAERMMRCDRFDADKKFVVACIYIFEDDIRRFWPLVCEKIDLNVIDYIESSVLYYWICRLKNELDKIPLGKHDNKETLDEEMLDRCMYGNNRCIEYFWNRIPLDRQLEKTVNLMYYHDDFFTRHVLPKLNDQQINFFMDGREGCLVQTWLKNRNYDEEVILQLWTRIKHLIDQSTFDGLMFTMLCQSGMSYRGTRDKGNIDDSYVELINKKWTYLCSEMWKCAPDNLKRSAIDYILFQSGGFFMPGPVSLYVPKNVGILLAILAYATFEDRNKFWNRAWPKLIDRTRGENLQRLMELCFKTQDEIYQFKLNVLAKSDDVKNLCVSYLKRNCFEDANDLVDFCCPEIQTARNLKQELLRLVFLSDRDSRLKRDISHSEQFNTFINSAFESVQQVWDFKKQMVLSRSFPFPAREFKITFRRYGSVATPPSHGFKPVRQGFIRLHKCFRK